MIPMDFIGPVGAFPVLLQTTANPPWNNVQVSLEVIVPAGPNGLAFISPVPVHLPTKYSSFLCSGPGFGSAGGACAATPETHVRMTTETKPIVLGMLPTLLL
jgi:hypothetical protein